METHRGMFRNGFQPRVAMRHDGHPLQLEVSSGDVHVGGCRGRALVVEADSGDVDVSASRAPQRLRVDAGSGD